MAQLQWALGALGGVTVFLCGLVGWLVKLAFDLGRHARAVESLRDALVEMKRAADRVPVLETRAEQLEHVLEAHVRKTDSDMRELRRSVWGRSSPGLANGDGEE